MIHHDLDLFYDIYNILKEHNRRQTHYVSSIVNCFDMHFLSESKSFFITLSASSLLECITHSSSLSSSEERKLIVIVN